MPPLEQMDLNQDALYYAWLSNNNYGQPVVSPTPVALNVRWNDKRIQTVDKDGNVTAYDGMIISDRELLIDSIMWLGGMADLPPGGIPLSRLVSIKRYDMFKSLCGKFTRHESYFMRFTDTLPVS